MIFIVILASLFFTSSDLLARSNLAKTGFTYHIFFTPWFALYCLLRVFATIGQLYVFSYVELGKTMALFGAVSIILSNILGLLLLKEVLSTSSYIGVLLAVTAIFIFALAK